MSIPAIGALFVLALFSCFAVLAHLTRERVVEQHLSEGRARRSPITEFVDDLQHRWIVIVGLGLLVAMGKLFGFFSDPLQSKLILAIVITLIFVGRLLLRRNSGTDPAADSAQGGASVGKRESSDE